MWYQEFESLTGYLIDRDLITDHYRRKWILAPLSYLFTVKLAFRVSGHAVGVRASTRM